MKAPLKPLVLADVPPMPVQVYNPARLAALAATALMGTEPDPDLDNLCELAASAAGTQQALVVLFDARHAFYKAAVGWGPLALSRRSVLLHTDACHLLAGAAGPLVAEDAACDARLAHLAGVRDKRVGAWAGFPLRSADGLVLGGLCVLDEEPRPWTAGQIDTLTRLAGAVSDVIELRRQVHQAQDRIDALRSSGAAADRLAQTLQDSLLPPVIARPAWLDAAALYLPASNGEAVVGDFYDLFPTRPPWWCAVLGDVSGKGLEAAKVTALARYTVRTEATQHASPATVLTRLNDALVRQRVNDRFLTAVCVMLRPGPDGGARGLISLGGHPPALIRRADATVEEAGRPGLLLGHFDDTALHAELVELAPGDALLLYTDGVTEAHSRGGHDLWGLPALSTLLAGCDGLNAEQMLERITSALTVHTGGYHSDDTALLLLRLPHPTEQRPR
ncbi:Serine phosphatase RsbU, regulator of sigma subunit [Nonomuraea solani]|uniref:Serine phosphatase RsbU, regulator of sigma subunit n=1 Tax=Nonomuraea solani TaxID=1144553 RepID=A0A1H6EYY7_9ACTN|nr:GAF domain-containing SpoIIE family protein phosphatase [Nonomuraea solani]SEH03118.1 Serine phosphatase RsbU, regulator of sigma subunit [Nonomuraea solani]